MRLSMNFDPFFSPYILIEIESRLETIVPFDFDSSEAMSLMRIPHFTSMAVCLSGQVMRPSVSTKSCGRKFGQ